MKTNWLDLDDLSEGTYSAVYSDVCNSAGMREKTLEPGAKLLASPSGVLIGWARTAVSTILAHWKWFDRVFQSIDGNQVLVPA